MHGITQDIIGSRNCAFSSEWLRDLISSIVSFNGVFDAFYAFNHMSASIPNKAFEDVNKNVSYKTV